MTTRTVRAVGELALIKQCQKKFQALQVPGASSARRFLPGSSVEVGIGDDAAVLRLPAAGRGGSGRERLLFASDMIVEGVHFQRRLVPAPWIGWKALAGNISDIAAMGGIPKWAVVSAGLPPSTPVRFVKGLQAGLARCARRYGVTLVGGDTVRAPRVVVDVAILGTVDPRRLTLRRGAKVGDLLYVTGRLGGSYRSGRHARFLPRVAEAQALVKRVQVHAMIDLSDGLASDLWQLSRASRVTLRVDEKRIPVARAARSVYHALTDGEDFELLFAVSPREAARVPSRIGACPVTRIGTVVSRGVGVQLQTKAGRITRLHAQGFHHF